MDETYLKKMFGLEGKVAVVTGGGGVLCGTLSVALARLGVKVAVVDLLLEGARRVADQIKAEGGQAISVQGNVLDKPSMEAAAGTVLAAFGRVDILINGAGGNKPQATTGTLSFFDLPASAVEWVFNLNFIGTLLPSQVIGKLMAEQKSGVILNISSMNAFRPLTRVPAYAGAKAAISNFTQWLAVHMNQEYSPGIRVNALAPGFFTPKGRFGAPEDLIATTLWLLSDGAGFVTGVVVPVDGGFSAFSGV